MTASAAFDQMAPGYDEAWTNSARGRLQREAVLRRLAPLFRPGQNVLDLGCGTGEDALYLQRAGIRVTAVDASPRMVEVARRRGVAADVLALEDLDLLEGNFDGALSNFGPLNCVENLDGLRGPLARLVRPGGFLVLCIMGRFCLWETVHYLARGEFSKAVRRWRGSSVSTSGLRVFYPTTGQVCRALAPYFRLVQCSGVGLFVPPSYEGGLSAGTLAKCAAMDRRIAHLPGLRVLSDHRLLVLARC